MTVGDRKAVIAHEQARLQSFGLSKDFAERANAAPPTAMWYPEKAELLREHVVTRVMEVPAQKPAANAASPAPSVAPVAVIAPGGSMSVLVFSEKRIPRAAIEMRTPHPICDNVSVPSLLRKASRQATER